MSHTFPPRKFATNEVVDPDVLNDVFQDIAGKIGGRLNEHDLSSELKTAPVPVAAEAYYDGHQIKRAASPDWVATATFYARLGGAAANDDVAVVEDSTGWQQLVDQTGTQSMVLDITCGEGDQLVMFSQAQHVAWGDVSGLIAALINNPVRLQYAFRLDGAVIDETIPGAAIWPDPPAQAWYRATATGSNKVIPATAEFDYRAVKYIQNTVGINQAAHPCRIIHSAQVAAGTRRVEVVARRLPPSDYKVGSVAIAPVQVFNRRLFVLRIKGMSPHTGEVPSVLISALDDGDTLAAADITTNGFTVLQTAVNALGNAHVERGALANQHLPSLLYGQRVQPLTSGSSSHTGTYPGYGVNGAGWSIVNDGAGTNLRITGPTAGEWDLVANPGTFIVLANVQLTSIEYYGALVASNTNQGIAVFSLRYTNAVGTVTELGECEVYINGHNFENDAAPIYIPIEVDVPLMWVVDSTTLSAADKHITNVEVVCSTWNGLNGIVATVRPVTGRGCIFGFVLKGVAL